MADSYDTQLSPQEVPGFNAWKQQYAPNDAGTDYDLQGAFKAGLKPDPQRGHFPDTFKKPNHPTFSTESQYSKGDTVGGKWDTRDGKDVFIPSQYNLKTTPPDKLKAYFQKVEPEAILDIQGQQSGLQDFRSKHPEYNDLSDQILADKLHDKFYADVPKEQYYQKLGVQVQPAAPAEPKDQGPPIALADEPGKEYGAILPFSRDKATGKTELAFPEMIRQPVQIASKATQEMFGERPVDTKTALEGAALGIGAGGPGATLRSGAREAGGAALTAKPLGESLAEVAQQFAKKPPATSEDMKKVAGALYKKAESEGGSLTPEFTNKFVDSIKDIAPQTAAGRATEGESEITKLIERYTHPEQGIRDKPMTLQAAQEIDEGLGKLISKEYTPKGLTKEGLHLVKVQEKLRDMIENAKASDLEGGKNGFNALKGGRQAWSQAAKMRDIEQIVTRAEHSEQPVTAIKSGIRTILANPKRLRGFSPEEQAALRNAAQTGVVTDVLRITGSKLGPLISSMAGLGEAGIPGMVGAGVLGHVISAGARNVGVGRQMKKVGSLMDVLNKPKTDLEALSQ